MFAKEQILRRYAALETRFPDVVHVHTTSFDIFPPDDSRRVPPQASTLGLDAGKST